MKDLDGTLSGQAGNVVVFKSNITKGDVRCNSSSTSYDGGIVCSNTKDWIKSTFAYFDQMPPYYMRVTNNKGNYSDLIPRDYYYYNSNYYYNYYYMYGYYGYGYMVTLEANQTYEIGFDYAQYPTNMSYSVIFYGLKSTEYLIIKHKMRYIPDQVQIYSGINATQTINQLSMESSTNGDWYWENNTKTMYYIVYGTNSSLDIQVNFKAMKCMFPKCEYPRVDPPVLDRSGDIGGNNTGGGGGFGGPCGSGGSGYLMKYTFLYWSNLSTWKTAIIIRNGQVVTNITEFPKNNDSILIPAYSWVIVDVPLPALTSLQIDGILEFDDTLDNKLSVNEIIINCGQLAIGWENRTFTHKVNIELTGDRSSESLAWADSFKSIGSKSITVYGGLDLHGIPRTPVWTKLNTTAKAGTNNIILIEPVDWKKDEEILLTTTSYSAFETETFKIINVSNDSKIITLNSTLKYDHIVSSEKFPNGKSYSIAAGVALLTRNIKVTGGQYLNQYNEMYGSRITVSTNIVEVDSFDGSSYVSLLYSGFIRVSNVEFNLFGQYSTYSGSDHAYGILFSNLGNFNPIRPSYLTNSAFHNGFSSAIGILGSNGISITNNVFHRTLDYALWIEGADNIISRNLVALNIWSPTILTSNAPIDKNYYGAIDISSANSAYVQDNFIAGSQRLGLHFRGSSCSDNSRIKGNTIYGTLIGAAIITPSDSLNSTNCLVLSDFIIYKSISVALYAQTTANLVFDSNVLIDNQLSIFPQVYTPESKNHESNPTRSIIISNNLIIGTSPSFNCLSDVPPNDLNSKYSTNAAMYGTGSGGKIGVVWANFLDGHNNAPLKPFFSSMTYSSINGLSTLTSNTFAYFKKTKCNSSVDAIITSSKFNNDGQMPVVINSSYLYQVENTSKIFLHRPNIDKINSRECGSMDCDGMKKNLLTDTDGTFLGSVGTVVSQSEYGWGTRTGLSDKSIPPIALVDSNGASISPKSLYNYQGIVRNESSCTYIQIWEAYECHGLDHAMLVIESMDSDTERRRLSPVAIVSDNGYIDLINGPSSHTLCFGYSCQQRISTFLSIVASNQSFDVFLTSTPPKMLRFRIIQAKRNFKIRLSMTYTTPNNINVYQGSILVQPTNADFSTGQLTLKDPKGNLSAYMPTLNSPAGSNYMNRTIKKVFFTIDSSNYIDLMIAKEIYVTFGVPATTANGFYKSLNLVTNIALLLGVPQSMIRRVEIVSANGYSKREKRQATDDNNQLIVLIAPDPPSSNLDTLQTEANILELKTITNNIASKYYFGQLQSDASNMNFTLSSMNLLVDSTQTDLKVIAGLKIKQDLSNCRAQSPCDYQPILQLVDDNVNKSCFQKK